MQWRREASFADFLAPTSRPAASAAPAAARLAAAAASQLAAEMATSPRKRARKSLAPARAAGDEPMLDVAGAGAGGLRRQGRCAGSSQSGGVPQGACAAHLRMACLPVVCVQLLWCLEPCSFNTRHAAASKTTAAQGGCPA